MLALAGSQTSNVIQDVAAVASFLVVIGGAIRYFAHWIDGRSAERTETILAPKLDAIGEHMKLQDLATAELKGIVTNGLTHNVIELNKAVNGDGNGNPGILADVQHHGQILRSLDAYPDKPGSTGALILAMAKKMDIKPEGG